MLFKRFRKVYFFGYGADREPEMIAAIIGRQPHVVGPAVLDDYELRIQTLNEVTDAGPISPRGELAKGWGKDFRSYVIVPSPGARVSGTLYRIRLHDRHMVDNWEMVDLGWYDKLFITVRLKSSGRAYGAETQVLSAGQQAAQVVDGMNYPSWLQPKQRFIQIAERCRLSQ